MSDVRAGGIREGCRPLFQGENKVTELTVLVGLRAKPGREDILRRELSALVAPSRSEAGNLRYDLFEAQDQPGLFVFVEAWSSTELRMQHHEHGRHIQHFHDNGIAHVEAREFAYVLKRVV